MLGLVMLALEKLVPPTTQPEQSPSELTPSLVAIQHLPSFLITLAEARWHYSESSGQQRPSQFLAQADGRFFALRLLFSLNYLLVNSLALLPGYSGLDIHDDTEHLNIMKLSIILGAFVTFIAFTRQGNRI